MNRFLFVLKEMVNFEKSLSSASLDDVKIVIVHDDGVAPDLRSKAINGNLVYLCRSNDDDTDDILECYGLGESFSIAVI